MTINGLAFSPVWPTVLSRILSHNKKTKTTLEPTKCGSNHQFTENIQETNVPRGCNQSNPQRGKSYSTNNQGQQLNGVLKEGKTGDHYRLKEI